MICPHFFFFNDTATTEIYTLSLHDALPISGGDDLYLLGLLAECLGTECGHPHRSSAAQSHGRRAPRRCGCGQGGERSEEHTSELQSRQYLVCRLLLEKKTRHKMHTARYQNS